MAPGGQRRRRRRANVIKKGKQNQSEAKQSKAMAKQGDEKCKVEADGKTEEPRLAAES